MAGSAPLPAACPTLGVTASVPIQPELEQPGLARGSVPEPKLLQHPNRWGQMLIRVGDHGMSAAVPCCFDQRSRCLGR
jgi:hypothetical protein